MVLVFAGAVVLPRADTLSDPPVAVALESLLIARRLSATLCVVRYTRTFRKLVQESAIRSVRTRLSAKNEIAETTCVLRFSYH